MTPASSPYRAAIIAALATGAGATALESAGLADADEGGVVTGGVPEGHPLPYVEVQPGTEVEGERSDATRKTSATATLVARADTLAEAEALIEAVVSVVGSRLTVAGFDVTATTLDIYGPAFQEQDGAKAWNLPVRVRSTLYQTATASE